MRNKSSHTINLSSACSIPGVHCALGESPVWDEVNERIVFIDILKGVIHQYAPRTGTFIAWSMGCMIGSVAMRPDGGMLASRFNTM